MEKVKVLFIIFLAGLMYAFGYKVAVTASDLRFEELKSKYANDYAALLQKKIDSERTQKELRQRIETNYLVELERQKQSYETLLTDLHTNFKPSGVSNCPDDRSSVSRTNDNTADVVCYRKGELQARIAKSMAIGQRCDDLAVRYNALLRLYETQNEELKKVNDVRSNQVKAGR